jgi:hypothetical protein
VQIYGGCARERRRYGYVEVVPAISRAVGQGCYRPKDANMLCSLAGKGWACRFEKSSNERPRIRVRTGRH